MDDALPPSVRERLRSTFDASTIDIALDEFDTRVARVFKHTHARVGTGCEVVIRLFAVDAEYVYKINTELTERIRSLI